MIDPAGIPTLDEVSAATIIAAGKALKTAGGGLSETGVNIRSAWQGLAPAYQAPEAGTLLAAMGPVQTKSAGLGSETKKVAAALASYGATVGQIKKRLKGLKAEAVAFVARMKALGEEWDTDPANVEENNRLHLAVTRQVQARMDAEDEAARQINAAYGAAAPKAQQGIVSGQEVAWGTPGQTDLPWWQDVAVAVGSFGAGFGKDGFLADLEGLANLAGIEKKGSGDSGKAWQGLLDLVRGLQNPAYVTLGGGRCGRRPRYRGGTDLQHRHRPGKGAGGLGSMENRSIAGGRPGHVQPDHVAVRGYQARRRREGGPCRPRDRCRHRRGVQGREGRRSGQPADRRRHQGHRRGQGRHRQTHRPR